MRKIFHDPNKILDSEINILWQLLIGNGGRSLLPKITRYIDQRYTYYDRWISALKTTVIPILILWGDRDPVAVIEMANRLHEDIPNSKLSILSDVGHYPMLEAPEQWTLEILEFLNA